MSLSSLLIPSFTQMLKGLSKWLQTGATGADADADALLTRRLADDMYPLASQVFFSCFMVQDAIFRLRGQKVPDAVEGIRRKAWRAGEEPVAFADAIRQIEDTMSLLDSLAPDALDQGADRHLRIELPNGLLFELSGQEYARDWALPQFYFHISMAYALLRHQGVELGKADYLAHILTYIQQAPAETA